MRQSNVETSQHVSISGLLTKNLKIWIISRNVFLHLPLMEKRIAIVLLFIMGISLFPWQAVCLAHPFGLGHHEHDGPSPCELHAQYANTPGEHILPPMECQHEAMPTKEYNANPFSKIIPQPLFEVAVVFFSFTLSVNNSIDSNIATPVPRCRSGTLLTDVPLRAPPKV